ncbi:hypothetical protein CHU98_g4553 [Xylaria longipes]|nr:hypothetical protein CHU98_g4553 [Xylaria longipes]
MDAFWSPNGRRSTSATKGAHFLRQDISKFDAGFFGLPKHDADAIDPQQRIIMEVAYEALERAGIPLEKLAGTRTGVFMGHLTSDYRDMICRDPDNAPVYTFTGTGTASVANRISWLWDLRGPSFPVNTACSSGLLALHLACQSLRTRESDIAIVGGSSLLMNPEMFMFLSNQGFLSPDGKCKSFDESADGYGRGEGFGCVILKRTNDAILADDPIRAIIRGTGSNQDGRTMGLTMPNGKAQMALIREVYQQAGLDFETTAYVEAHGTGTKIGDTHEMAALASTIASVRSADNRLIVGSVKSNIGHLEAAAGIAGIIKAVLMLETGLIPPNINFKKGNPEIDFENWNVDVPTKLSLWPTDGVRRISVNSFGYGGLNAHAVLDDAYHYLCPKTHTSKINGKAAGTIDSNGLNQMAMNGANGTNGAATNGRISSVDGLRSRLFVFSAQDKDGLNRLKEPLTMYIKSKAAMIHQSQDLGSNVRTDTFMAELAYTLSERRSSLQWKTYVIASSLEELTASLNGSGGRNHTLAVQSSKSPRLGFVFSGQGAQWPRMGAELMVYAAFQESIEAADRHLRQICGCPWSVTEELLKEKKISLINQAAYSHPLSSILQVALVDLLKTWNITPTAVVGHSGGEIGASYASGALSREDAWKIAYYRGCISAAMKIKAPKLRGSMLAAGLSQEAAAEWISKVTDGHLVVACINSPVSTTIAGDNSGIEQLLKMLQAKGVFARKLVVDTAYHSPHMAIMAEEYRNLTVGITPITGTPTHDCTMYSTVTGCKVERSQLGVEHWVASLTSPVKFSEAIYNMVRPIVGAKRPDENAVDVLVEIGPHSTLQGPSTQSLNVHNIGLPHYSVLTRHQNASETAINLTGALFSQGCNINVREVNVDSHMRFATPLVDLPTYSWNHTQRFWHDSRGEGNYLSRAAPKPGLIGAPTPPVAEGERLWKGFIRLSEAPWIADHKIQGSILYPGAGFIAMALEAAVQTANPTQQIATFKLRDIQLTSAAILTEEADLECIVQLRPHVSGTRGSASAWTQFVVTTSPDGKSLVQNCCGLLLIEYEAVEGTEASQERAFEQQALKKQYAKAQQECINHLDVEGFYSDMRLWGLEYGPIFTNVCEARNRDGMSVGAVCIPEVPTPGFSRQTPPNRPHAIHPGTLDAVFHLAFAAVKGGRHSPTTAMVPKRIDAVTVSANIPYQVGTKLPGFSTAGRHGVNELTANIVMFDDENQLPTINIEGFLCAEVGGGSSSSTKSITSKLVWKPAIGLHSLDELLSVPPKDKAETKLIKYCELLHHSYPALSVLEIAAEPSANSSTPISSTPLLGRSELASVGRTWDVTVSCRDQTRVKLGTEQDTTSETLDLEQARPAESLQDRYDLLIVSDIELCSNVSNLAKAIACLCKIVKQGGTLCILATRNILPRIQPSLNENKMIISTFHGGDPGPDLIIATRRHSSKVNGTTNGTANGSSNLGGNEITIIHAASPTKAALTAASTLARIFPTYGYEIKEFFWSSDMSSLKGKSCISLVEFQQPLLKDMTEEDFESVKKLLLETSDVFWVTALNDPATAMIDGLSRVIRNETPGVRLRTFHADDSPYSVASVGYLSELMARAFLWIGEDQEFQVRVNLVHICRIDEDAVLNDEINALLPGAPKTVTNAQVGELKHPVKLCVRSPGMLSSVCLEPDDSAQVELEPDFIEIQTKATALKTLHRSRADFCALIPDGMTFEQAASIPVVHATAWNALVRVANVQEGQSILIHAAAGGVGQVAIQIAQHYRMEIFATVSSEAKRKLIRDQGVLDDHIFNSRDLSFAKGVKRMTSGRGVDVILNSLAGEALRQTWHCIAPFGHFVEIGIKDILNNTGLDMQPFMQDATFSFFNLRHVDTGRPDLMATILEGAFDFIRRGITRPSESLVTFPISEVEDALRLMQTGKHLGKIALTWGEDDIVPVLQKGLAAPTLSPEYVYMLVGGLGGLGRSLASKLVDLGARKLCFLSRSGAQSPSAKDLILNLEQQQVKVHVYKCDVGDESAVIHAVNHCTQDLGKIKGVFQCAMVLRDGLFSSMTHQRWVESTAPKVQGSWNLHKHLPRDLDIFITLSSFTGVFGSRGQSNYSAAGAYEDALAYHRRACGQSATTVDLGLMRDIGVLAETGMTDAFREWEEPYGIREKEFSAIMERVVDRDMRAIMPPQVITGLATGGSVRRANISTPYYLDDARFSIMARIGLDDRASPAAGGGNIPTYTLISQAKSFQEATSSVLEALVKQVAKMLQTDPSEIDINRFLNSFGIDSLVAIEIVNWVVKEVKSAITVFDVLAGVPIMTLCNRIAARSTALPRELVPL